MCVFFFLCEYIAPRRKRIYAQRIRESATAGGFFLLHPASKTSESCTQFVIRLFRQTREACRVHARNQEEEIIGRSTRLHGKTGLGN